MKKPANKRKPAAQDQTPAPALMPRGTSLSAKVQRADAWRDWYNPLYGLRVQEAIVLLDHFQAGITANLEWIYQLIERRDDDLLCCIESTNAAMLELSWYVRDYGNDKRMSSDFDKGLAAEQSAALYERYKGIRNLYDAIEHLSMAKYRGYSHVQIRADGAWLNELQVLNQWNVAREGYVGSWYWNPAASNTKMGIVNDDNRLDDSCYLICECRRAVNEVGFLKYLRGSMCDKDWDAFIEIYGLPSWIITMPSVIPPGKEQEYADRAADVAAGGSGALPNGSTAEAAGYPQGEPPFEKRMRFLSERLIRAATGGLLTSLAMPTGIGSGATDAHSETFKRISRARARMISAEFQRKIDGPILEQNFPGRPRLAFFELDARESMDVGQVFEHAVKARQAGFSMDPAQLKEKTGYTLTPAPTSISDRLSVPEPGAASAAGAAVRSRASAVAADASSAVAQAGTQLYAEATRKGLRPLAEALWPLLDIDDPAALASALKAVLARFPDLAKQVLKDKANATVLQDTLAAAAANGIAAAGVMKKEAAK